MPSKAWFRCDTWDEPTRAAFEARLARSRTRYNKAQYLRIQGLTLIETNKRREVDAGKALLERLITEYPDEPTEVSGAHSYLANSYLRDGRLNEAIEHLRLCLIVESGSGVSHRAELRLAEALLANNPTDAEMSEVTALLNEFADEAFFHSERWRIAVALARLRAKQGDVTSAAAHAEEALALLADNTPKLPRHTNVGLIETDPATVKEMQQLANRSTLS